MVSRSRPVSRHRLVGRGRLVGNWGRLVGSRGRLVGSRSRFVCRLLRVGRLSFILYISNIALWSSTVSDNLHSSIRKVNSILSSSVIILSFLLLRKNRSVVWVIHTILVIVAGRNSWVG